jgi:DNA-binding NtrC family response regulator
MRIQKYPTIPHRERETEHTGTSSELDRHLEQLLLLATALSTEIEALQAEIDPGQSARAEQLLKRDGIDFYREVERYEIALIRGALERCNGNQTHAATLLQMKSTTLNAKMKHYGLHSVRSIVTQRTTRPT